MNHFRLPIALFSLLFSLSCQAQSTSLKRNADAGFNVVETLPYRIVRELPHSTEAFTEGLELHDGKMLESVGQYGRSALILKEIGTGKHLREQPLDANSFGEGLTVFGDSIYQLTWREQLAIRYNLKLEPMQLYRYSGEGWGLTHDHQLLIMSDGSSRLSFRRPDDFSLVRSIDVRNNGQPVMRLNELEYAHHWIFANIWQTDQIVVIDPDSGVVRARLDLSALRRRFAVPAGWNPRDDVLNGIAWDPRSDHYYVTGKRWPLMFELQIAAPQRKP